MNKEEYTTEEIINLYNTKNIDKYNFNIKSEIDSFSFEDLVKRNRIAAILFFTDNQYVISYTENYGKGSHDITLTRIYKDIYGGGKITSDKEYEEIKEKLKDYIFAKITFFTNRIHIFFEGLDNLNNKNYNSFLTFYDNFNELFKVLSTKIDFKVSFFNSNKRTFMTTNSFDFLLEYLQEQLENSILEPNNKEETIIGIPTNLKKKKK